MTIDQKHLLLTARGSYADSDETSESWTCGVRLWADKSAPTDEGSLPTTGAYDSASDADASMGLHCTADWSWGELTGPVVNPISYLQNQGVPAWAALIGASVVSSNVLLKDVRLYPMQGDGRAFESRVAIASIDTPVPGGRSGDMLPPQTAIVGSWRTRRPGPKGRGRIYLPATTESGTDSDGRMQGTMQGDAADALQAFLEALTVETAFPTGSHVRPIVTGDPWTQYAVITSLDVGNIFDTQRRRRRSLVETRTSRSPSY